MEEKDFADFDEEEFEMIINGLIHPQDMFVSPDLMGYPPAVGGPGMGMPGMGGMGGQQPFSDNAFDSMIAQAYDEEDGEAQG